MDVETKKITPETIKKTPEPSKWELTKFALILLIIFLPIRFFAIGPFVVYGSSMEPNFYTGEYLIVDEISYDFIAPHRGDVIVLRPPINTNTHFIKRVIGLPNETVKIDGTIVTIINAANPNGFVLNEPYLAHHKGPSGSWTLGSDEYFVLGDNRDVSDDSRIWGPLKKNMITGRALLRLYPFKRLSFLPGQ